MENPEINVQDTFENSENIENTQNDITPVNNTKNDKIFKILITAASVFLSLVLFLAVTGAAAGFLARSALSADSVQTITRTAVKELDLSQVYGFAVGSVDTGGLNIDEDADLVTAILDNIDEYYIETYDIDQDAITEILENDSLLEFAADILAGLGEFITGGQNAEELIVTPDEVVSFIEDNQDVIEDITGYTFLETDFDDIREALTETLADITWGAVMDEVMYEAPLNFDTIRGMISVQMLIGLQGVAVLLAALIIFANRKGLSGLKGLIYCGAAITLSGVVLLLAQLAFGLVYSLAEEHFGLTAEQTASALSDVRGAITLTGVLVLTAGLLTIAAAIVIPIIKNRACKEAEVVV